MQKVLCRSFAIALVAVNALVARAAANDPVVARYHFVGTSQLTAAHYKDVRKLLTDPASLEYRELVLNRFSEQIARSISVNAATVRPMLTDLLTYESAGVFGVPGAEPQSFVIAIRLPAERANAWKQALGKSAKGLHVQQEGEWLVAGRGAALKEAEEKFVAEVKKNHRPVAALNDAILETDIDWPRLTNVPAISRLPFKPAFLQVKVSPKGNKLRTEVHAHYPQPIAWKSQPWKLPTETIQDPLVSFTAGQNASAFMNPSQLAQLIGENPFTNQYFIFANVNVPFETAALFPMKNAQRHVQSLGRELPAKLNAQLRQQDEGELKWNEKTNQLAWRGLPIILPYVKPVREKAGDFVRVGTFLHIANGPPAPAELWDQIKGKNDLVYYDWEFTGPRLMQWRMTAPLLPIFPTARTNDTAFAGKTSNQHTPKAIVDKWLTALVSNLSPTKENPGYGNVVTEVIRNGASDYIVVRNSQVGFTAIELMLLSHWLADTKVSEVHAAHVEAPAPHGLQQSK